jgi:hypothetical protein
MPHTVQTLGQEGPFSGAPIKGYFSKKKAGKLENPSKMLKKRHAAGSGKKGRGFMLRN